MASGNDTTIPNAHSSHSAPPPQQRYSCVLCSRRKVRCDRRVPCSNCSKVQAVCEYKEPPPRQRRRNRDIIESRRQPAKSDSGHSSTNDFQSEVESLRAEVQLYKETLREQGVQLPEGSPRRSPDDQHDERMAHLTSGFASQVKVSEDGEGRMVSLDGEQRYVENPVLADVNEEFGEDDDYDDEHEEEEREPDAFDYMTGESLLGMTRHAGSSGPTHPSPDHIMFLWRKFLENVNPIVKVIHAPTTECELAEAMRDLSNVPRDLEAMMFGMYTLTVTSLSNEECEQKLGQSRNALLQQYQADCRRALVRADYLRSGSLNTLRALNMLLNSLRIESNEPHIVWIMGGSATRIAMRMGLHRDGTVFGLSPFETEMRRRLWNQLCQFDAMMTEMSGSATSIVQYTGNVEFPGNYNDSDLYPDMPALPPEREGPTEMIFVQLRFEILRFLRSLGLTGVQPTLRRTISSMTDENVTELENNIENKFVRFCDPINPLHVMTQLVARNIILKMRMGAVDRNNQGRSSAEAEEQRFSLALRTMEYYALIASSEILHRFAWHYRGSFQFESLVYMLNSLRHKTLGAQVEGAWHTLEGVFKANPDLLGKRRKRPLNAAVCRLAVKAWEMREQAVAAQLRVTGDKPRNQLTPTTSNASSTTGVTPSNSDATPSLSSMGLDKFPLQVPWFIAELRSKRVGSGLVSERSEDTPQSMEGMVENDVVGAAAGAGYFGFGGTSGTVPVPMPWNSGSPEPATFNWQNNSFEPPLAGQVSNKGMDANQLPTNAALTPNNDMPMLNLPTDGKGSIDFNAMDWTQWDALLQQDMQMNFQNQLRDVLYQV